MTIPVKTQEQVDRGEVRLEKERVAFKSPPGMRAKDISQALSGTINERIKEDKSILITMKYGEKPEVVFSGFWNGHLIKSAMTALSVGYRHRRHKNIRSNATAKNREE